MKRGALDDVAVTDHPSESEPAPPDFRAGFDAIELNIDHFHSNSARQMPAIVRAPLPGFAGRVRMCKDIERIVGENRTQ